MSDIVKWTILIALVILIMASLMALPIFAGFNIPALAGYIGQFIGYCGNAITWGRQFINNFLYPEAITALSGLVFYFVAKPFMLFSIDLTVGISRFIYK